MLNKFNDQNITQVLDIFTNSILDDCANNVDVDTEKYFKLLFPKINYSLVNTDAKKPKQGKIIKSNNNTLNNIHDQQLTNNNMFVPELVSNQIDTQHKPFTCKTDLYDRITHEHVENNVIITDITTGNIVVVPPMKLASKPVMPTVQKPKGMTSYDDVINELKEKCKARAERTEIKIVDNFYDSVETKKISLDNTKQLIREKPKMSKVIVFHDYRTNTYNKVVFTNNPIDSIYNDVLTKLCVNEPTLIKDMLSTVHTVENIKNDQNFKDGPFIIKINDNNYDCYEKITHKVTIVGYFYNSPSVTVEIKHVGNYGLLL
jgi:hypothetical protein